MLTPSCALLWSLTLLLCFACPCSKVGLNVLIQRANKFTPATRLLIQRFVPFPAVGKEKFLFFLFQGVAAKLQVARRTQGWTQLLLSAHVLSEVVPELAGTGLCRAEFRQKNS